MTRIANRANAFVAALVAATLAAAAAHAGQAPAAAAGDEPSYPAAHPKGKYGTLEKLPDWGGVWVLAGRGPNTAPREQPALKGEYLAQYEAWRKEVKDNNGVARKRVSNCMPPGMPNMMATGQYPIEFLFTPGRVTTHHEAWMQWRNIYTDGRPHPADWDGGIFGHSIGHWEGSTLVIDTIGIKTITELGPGIRHSDKLHITERVMQEPKDPDTLTWQLTMEDPEALEKPYRITHTYKRHRDWNLLEFICAENDRNPVGEDGHTKFE
jgi:hypothetical protein